MLNRNKVFFPIALIFFACLALIAVTFCIYVSVSVLKVPPLAYMLVAVKVLFSLFLLSSSLSDKSKCSWIFLTLLIPALAIPAYLVFSISPISKVKRIFAKSLSKRKPKKEPFETKMLLKCNQNFTYIREIANYSNADLYINTTADYFEEGKKMFLSLIQNLKKARSFIFLEFYIVAAGEAFGNILDILIKKAKEGVEIRIIYDGIGSLLRLPDAFVSIMKSNGIKAISHPSFSSRPPWLLNNRNHRKIAIIDGEIAYTGGINLADEYIYSKARLGRWKDCAVKICGEGVDALTYTFLSDFAFLAGAEEDFSKYYKYRKRKCDGQAIIFSDGPSRLYKEKSAKRIITSMLDAAEKYFIFTTPYLICDNDIFNAVKNAVTRGVTVRAVIPKRPDKYLIFLLTRRYAQKLASAGVRVYLYTPGFMHSKIYLCDGKFLMLGTVNLDYRSLFHNYENGILFAEHPIIKQAKEDLDSIISESEEYKRKKESLPLRLICSVLEIFSPLL